MLNETENKIDEFLNEWTQVYLNGGTAYGSEQGYHDSRALLQHQLENGSLDNLKVLTSQLDNGSRQPNVVYSVLRGMGIDRQKAAFAVETFMRPPVKENIEKNENTMNNKFDLSSLKERIVALKEELESFVAQDSSKINYSASNALKVVAASVSGIDSFFKREERVSQISEELIDIESKENKHLYTNTVIELTNEKEILVSQIKENKTIEKYKIASILLKELAVYEWLNPVENFLSELKIAFNSNICSFKVNETLYVLKNNRSAALYKDAITEMEKIADLEEESVRGELPNALRKFNWIPQVDRLIKECEILENSVSSNSKGVIRRIFSPVQVNEDGSFTFNIHGKYYSINNDSFALSEGVNLPDSRFINVETSLRDFTITNETLTTYNRNGSLEINLNEGSVTVNDKKLEFTNIDEFRNHMVQTVFFGINEMHKLDQVCFLVESHEMIKELDFCTSIESTTHAGVFVNIINVSMNEGSEEKIYLNRINPGMGVNELHEIDTATNAQTMVNEYIDFDISKLVYSKLEEEEKVKVELENSRDSYREKIAFLENKKKEILSAMKEVGVTDALKEAADLIDSEIKGFEKDLQETYTELSEKKS